MSDALETQLRSEMQATADTTPPAAWDDIVQGADRMHRRDRGVQRFAVFGFLAAIAGTLIFAVQGGTRSGQILDPAQGPDGATSVGTVSTGHLAAGLVVLAMLGITFAFAAARRQPSAGWKLWQRYLVVPPVVYPLLAIANRPGDLLVSLGLSDGYGVALAGAFKLQAVLCVPALIYYVAQRIGEQPKRAVGATVTWSLLGVGLVLIARAFINDIVRIANDVGGPRLWPDMLGSDAVAEQVLPGLSDPPGDQWNPDTILQVELIAVVGCALVAGAILFFLRKQPVLAAPALMIGMWFALMTYNTLLAPMGFVWDFDPFIGDIILGAVFFELSFFLIPVDIAGALAVATAALSLASLLWLWGGPNVPKQAQD